MEYKQLGKSDLNISRIGFGCMSLKGDARDNEALINTALDTGVNYFDTADLYDKGNNEKMIGTLLKHHRPKVVIATKVGNQWRADGSGWDWNPTKQYIISAVDASLKRLQTDYIDLYQLHGGTLDDPINETIEAFEQLQHQGKIRYYGISSIRPNVIREYLNKSNIVSNMMQYSLLDRRPEECCFEMLEQHQVGVLARGSIAQGLLAGKPPKPYLADTEEEVLNAAGAIQQVSAERSDAQTALRFVLQQSPVTSAVVGVRTMEQLLDAIYTFKKPELSPEEMEALRQSITPKCYEQHR